MNKKERENCLASNFSAYKQIRAPHYEGISPNVPMQLCLNGSNNFANPIMFCVRRAAAAPKPGAVKANSSAVVGMLCSRDAGPHVQVSAD